MERIPAFFQMTRRRFRRLRYYQHRHLSLGSSKSLQTILEYPAYPDLKVVDPNEPSRYAHRETRCVSVHEGAILWPDFGVISSDQRIVEKSVGFSEDRTRMLLAQGLLRNYPIINARGLVIPFGQGRKNHYHYLIDDISRFVLFSNLPAQYRRDAVLVVTEDLPRPYLELALQVLGDDVNIKIVPERSRIRCEQFLSIPPFSRSNRAFVEPYVGKALSRNLQGSVGSRKPRRVFISRKKAAKRRILNEEQLVTELRGFNFFPVVLEELSLSEQRDIFCNAELVIANHGAGLTNLIFSEKSPRVLELHFRKPAEHYKWLCHSLGFSYHSVVVDAPSKNSDVEAPVEEILKWVTSRLPPS